MFGSNNGQSYCDNPLDMIWHAWKTPRLNHLAINSGPRSSIISTWGHCYCRSMEKNTLKERLDAERAMYQKMLLTHAVSPIENPNKIKESRKNIARCLTELRAREIAEQSK